MFDNIVITGNIGSGKSTLLNFFSKKGFNIISSDSEIQLLMDKSYHKYDDLAKLLDFWLNTDFSNSSKIDKIILQSYMKNSDDYKKLSKIFQPFIEEVIFSKCMENKKNIIEIPLLFENNLHYLFKNIIVVTGNIDVRRKRVFLRNSNMTNTKFEQIISTQIQEYSNYIPYISVLIENNFDKLNDFEDFLEKNYSLWLNNFKICD